MKTITIKEFAEMAMALEAGGMIDFRFTDEDRETSDSFITILTVGDSYCLYANAYGGGRPLVIDVSVYDSDLRAICEELDQYINNGAGHFGVVMLIERDKPRLPAEVAASAASSGTHMLISATECNIGVEFFSSYEKAREQMEKELDETMSDGRDVHEDDYSIDEYSAWSNAIHNNHHDWLIVHISNNNIGFARPSAHLTWDSLDEIARERLSFCAERRIEALSDRSDYYYWGFNLTKSPFSKAEIEKLFLTYGADDHDRESNGFGEYPITEIDQGLAEKIVSTELPFTMDCSHADDNGVWFFGAPCGEQVNILVRYPEVDMEPDVVRFALNERTTKEALIKCANSTAAELRSRKDDGDRLSHFDDFITLVKEKTGCGAAIVYTDHDVDIW